MSRAMKMMWAAILLLLACGSTLASPDVGQTAKQPTNWLAISMFAVFVIGTLWITKWACLLYTSRCV